MTYADGKSNTKQQEIKKSSGCILQNYYKKYLQNF